MRTSRKPRGGTAGVVGYVRVSTTEQADSGLGLEAQRAAITAECARRGVELLAIHADEGLSAKTLSRPGLAAALNDLATDAGDVLMVAKLDRLTRSVHDATGLMRDADRAGWGLVALDVAVDTTTPQGAAMAQVLAVFAELERRLIGQRTREALAVKRAQGVRLGRPVTLSDDVADRIRAARASGRSYAKIAAALNADGVATAHGGKAWYPSSVRAVVERVA